MHRIWEVWSIFGVLASEMSATGGGDALILGAEGSR